MIYHMLVGLDGTVGLGSRVISYSQVPGGKRLEHLKRMDKMARMEKASRPWRALKDGVAGVVMAEGIMGSRHELEEFVKDHAVGSDGIAGISRIFVLTDQASVEDVQQYVDPDSGVISTILHLRRILQELQPATTKTSRGPVKVTSIGKTKGTKGIEIRRQLERRQSEWFHVVPIIAEIRDRETEEHCRELQVLDFVDVVHMALAHGELVLGWTRPRKAEEIQSRHRP